MRSFSGNAIAIAGLLGVFTGLSGVATEPNKGIGPVTEVKLTESVDAALAEKGKVLFNTKCSACHKMDERYVGPALKGVLKRRAPEWVMNMMLNPAEMLEKDETAKELLGEFLVPMTFQNVSQDEARAMVEYFRQHDAAPAAAPAASKVNKAKKGK